MRGVPIAVTFASAAALAAPAGAQSYLGRGVAPGSHPAAASHAPAGHAAGGTPQTAHGGFATAMPHHVGHGLGYAGTGYGTSYSAGYGGLGYGGYGYGGFGTGYGGFGYSSVGPGYSSSFNYYNGPVGGYVPGGIFAGPGGYGGYGLGGYGLGAVGYGSIGVGGYGGAGYGYAGLYGTAIGPPYPILRPDPLNNSYLRRQADAQWRAWSANMADEYLASQVRGLAPNATALPNDGDATAGTAPLPEPSSPDAKLRSLRAQAQGDAAFQKQDYRHAYERYKAAVEQARDRGEAYFRLGYALVALGRFDTAVQYFRRGLAIEPGLALNGAPLDSIYGEDNKIAKVSHVERLTAWAEENPTDPNRLFLLGLVLYYDGGEKAREFLQDAWKLSGGDPAIGALLNPAGEAAAADEGVPILDPQPTPDATSEGPALPDVPPPPAPSPTLRPPGEEPLFPLPSEQAANSADNALPPLPSP